MVDKEFNLKLSYPVICTRNIALFPNNDIKIDAGRIFSKNAAKKALNEFEGYVIVLPQLFPTSEKINIKELSKIGVISKIKNTTLFENGIMKISLSGLERVEILDLVYDSGCYFASCKLVDEIILNDNENAAFIKVLESVIQENLAQSALNEVKTFINFAKESQDIGTLADKFAQSYISDFNVVLNILQCLDHGNRMSIVIEFLENEKLMNTLENEISQKVRKKLDENQKEYILREKLRIIKEELGDVAPKEQDSEDIRSLVEKNPYPESVKQKILTELQRLENMPQASTEYGMLKTYIDWLTGVPWYQKSDDNDDINNVEVVLNEDHYGLEKIKERIIEYLAVKTLTSSLKAPILCFVGPPGVGKTSLAKSIARALDRRFVKVSLGGVKDESEIRGHRRTYVGALPGRIIQSMKKAQVINPVFLLDEIDKMGADYKGDPASAMLELLDPEQNKFFSDHYIEEPYDLSNVLFIATANYLENIPAPLRDRLEIIQISSYTEIEKTNIALKHLIAKQLIAHGLDDENITFSEDAILHIIRYYTREAGVRNLERAIAKICRKLVVQKLKNNRVLETKHIDIEKVQTFLGKELFDYTKIEKEDEIGVVTGLAYTEFGGDVLPIEVNYFEGKGHLVVTGSLGDVMKESASIAFDYVKSNAELYHIDKSLFEKIDIHIHVPEGAVPKDGPSAGITMTTAIVSALTKRSVKANIAMTGEVTLRGNVLAIGGLKEKSISAHRSGINTVIIPKDNTKDLDELPRIVLDEITFIPVSNVSQVIPLALNENYAS